MTRISPLTEVLREQRETVSLVRAMGPRQHDSLAHALGTLERWAVPRRPAGFVPRSLPPR